MFSSNYSLYMSNLKQKQNNYFVHVINNPGKDWDDSFQYQCISFCSILLMNKADE